MTQEKATAERFMISTLKSGYYYVSIPNYEGGEVVRAEDYDALLSEVAQLKALYDRIFTIKSTGDREHPVQAVIDYDAKAAFDTALESLAKER